MTGHDCLVANDWICGEYVRTRAGDLADATVQHLWITGVSVALGLVVAFPLALAARRWKPVAGPVLGFTTILYTVPSLAMFSLLLPVFGLSPAVVVTGLVLYSLTILVRNLLAGLEAVPQEVREAARGMGMSSLERLRQVEIPLAVPVIMAGVRIAVVINIGITAIATYIGAGGLGSFISRGISQTDSRQLITGAIAVSLLAIAADYLLLWAQHRLTPVGIRTTRLRVHRAIEGTAPV